MHPFIDNQMFILALVTIIFIGVVCIGLIVVLALFMIKQKCNQPRQENTSDPIKTIQGEIKQSQIDNIEKGIEKTRISRWTTGAVFGGSILFLGISNLLRLIINPNDVYYYSLVIAIVGFGFMFICWFNADKERKKFENKWKKK
jgi:purine-cytosine permease-like protein